ncbi:hypothetical protein AHAS_Ahas11G0243500 [Arachis hypogaea]
MCGQQPALEAHPQNVATPPSHPHATSHVRQRFGPDCRSAVVPPTCEQSGGLILTHSAPLLLHVVVAAPLKLPCSALKNASSDFT